MKKNVCKLFMAALVVASVLFSSCGKEDDYGGLSSASSPLKSMGGGLPEDGSQSDDPYDISNMRVAMDRLRGEGIEFPFVQIEPTGKYVRILAVSEYDRNMVLQDSSILWFDYPLNYELPEGSTSYHDPLLPDSSTYLYGVVPVSFSPPSGMNCELIYEVFIPDEVSQYKEYQQIFDLLEDEAAEVCGYDDGVGDASKANKWNPYAKISAFDNIAGSIALEGVKVIAKRFTKTRCAYTNASGECTLGEFKNNQKVKYSIKWEGAYWDIRDGYWKQAYYSGPELKGAWYLSIGASEKSNSIAAIHRAVHYGCYGDILGIQRPTLSYGKTKISYIDGTCGVASGTASSIGNLAGLIPNICIWGYNSSSQRISPSRVLSTTLHELGHVSHRKFIGNNAYWNANDFIVESWASVVQEELTNRYYNITMSSYPWFAGYQLGWTYQDWTQDSYGGLSPYTPVFIDLMDDYNQHTENTNYIVDEISGYTLKEIQDNILQGSYGLTSLRTKLKANKMHGATDSQIDNLLNNYIGTGF